MPGKRRPTGIEPTAHWREAGAWWIGEPQLETAEWRDRKGIKRSKQRPLPALEPVLIQNEHTAETLDDYVLRPFKTRDEKVSKACGLIVDEWTGTFKASERPYVPLHCVSGYSFGRSVLLARELPRRAAYLGLPAMALADRFALTGAMEFYKDAKQCGVKALVGATVELEDGSELVLIARTAQGYRSLSHLLTACHLEEPRLFPLCRWERLERFASDQLVCLTGGDNGPLNRRLGKGDTEAAMRVADQLVGLFGRNNVFVEIERSFLPWERSVNDRLLELAERLRLTAVAGGPVTHTRPGHFPAQDVLVCSETLCTVEEVTGRKAPRHPSQPQVPSRPGRALNAERYLRSADEMGQLYRDRPDLLQNTLRVAERCDGHVLPKRSRLPSLFDDPPDALRHFVMNGAALRYKKVTPALRERLDHELERIVRLGFSDHFLTAWDVCRWASEQNIVLSGRGSVVDSAVAYCLGLSRIDAFAHGLHFDRFLPDDGSKRPDIDIDFEAKRRDDVRNYMIGKYGADNVATVAAIGAFNTRGIVREVGKALGLTTEAIGYVAKRIHGGVPPSELASALQLRPELRDSKIDPVRLHWVFQLGALLTDVPRNIRAHSSGVIVSATPVQDFVPVQWSGGSQDDGEKQENLRIIQWDKRSAKHCFDKFDVLCLRGQDVISGTQARVRQHDLDFNAEALPLDDEETYRAMRSGELIGIPQSASPAMRQAHVRLQTNDLADASLVQAGIRPGVGGAVKINELIARKRGLKPYSFEHPDFEKILAHTYGIVVFQEQIDQLLQTFAGFDSGAAEEIREEIHKRRREDYGQVIKDELLARMAERGYPPNVAQHAYELIAGFNGYGFAQGHALAFADISIRSVWCQQNHPAEYFASMLDAQPAGYYGPCTLVNEARRRGVAVLPVDVDQSTERFEVQDVVSERPTLLVPNGGIRLSLGTVAGLSAKTRRRIVAERGDGYRSFFDFVRRVKPNRDELENLILCGAFDGFKQNRRALLWAIPSALQYGQSEAGTLIDLPEPPIDRSVADFTDAEKALRERSVLGLDVQRHLMSWERERVSSKGGATTEECRSFRPNTKAVVVGNPIRLRFPPTPSGKRVVFFDLEDETGLLNVTCFDRVYKKYGHAFVCSPYVALVGHVQWRDGCTAFLLEQAYPYRPAIAELATYHDPLPIGANDFLVG
jgi:error-prone DNA polymerase